MRGSKGAQFPGSNHYGGDKSLQGTPKTPNNATNTFFNTVHLLPKDLGFENGGAKLAACLGRHLISLRPCLCSYVWRHKDNKAHVRTTLRLAYHSCKSPTHTSKTRRVKRTQMVAAARFTISMFVTFSDF